ncbi:MAG: hypothetical protein ACRECH_05740 [Nitrososphaerales archaeon]
MIRIPAEGAPHSVPSEEYVLFILIPTVHPRSEIVPVVAFRALGAQLYRVNMNAANRTVYHRSFPIRDSLLEKIAFESICERSEILKDNSRRAPELSQFSIQLPQSGSEISWFQGNEAIRSF